MCTFGCSTPCNKATDGIQCGFRPMQMTDLLASQFFQFLSEAGTEPTPGGTGEGGPGEG